MTRGPHIQFSGVKPSSETLTPLASHLRTHVTKLAGDIGERNVFTKGSLKKAEAYLTGVWRDQNYDVTRQEYEVQNRDLHVADSKCANLEVVRIGTKFQKQIVVIGAHYDSVDGTVGANDNASGVAALLELSRRFAAEKHKRTVKFVAFVNEEPPFFTTGEQGSRVYAKAARVRGDDIRAMISLETIGYYSDAKGSQKYPPVLSWFYPDVGNFLGFVSNFQSRNLMHRGLKAFRKNSDFPTQCASTFEKIEGVGWSDHASFWAEGYKAFMVSDTAPFRYPHYHEQTDTPDKLHYDKLARATEGLYYVITELAKGE